MTAIRTFRYGSNRMMFQYATALRDAGHEVTFGYQTSPTEEDIRTGDLLSELDSAGIKTVHIPQLSLAMFPGFSSVFSAVVRERKIDLVISTQLRAAPGSMAIASRCRIPGIIFAQGAPAFNGSAVSRSLKRMLFARTVRAATDMVICVAPAIRTQLIDHFGLPENAATVVLNGVDLNEVPATDPNHRASVRQEFHCAEDEFLFLTMGRFDPVKGLDILIEAVAKIAALHTTAPLRKFRILIAAEAYCTKSQAYRQKLESLAQSLGVGRYFEFIGFREDVNRLMQAADCFLLPSRSEGLPLVILEAFAATCPVIMSEYGERFENFRNDLDGVYVPVEDPAALAAAMVRFLQLRPTQLTEIGQNGRAYLEKHLSVADGKLQFVDVVENVLNNETVNHHAAV